MIRTQNLLLKPATLPLLDSIVNDKSRLETLLGVAIPDKWPDYREAYSFSYKLLKADPTILSWWTYLFICPDEKSLVGSGGFKGKPKDGVVEIGYEIAPEFRNRGFATEAARGMVEFAFSNPEVTSVQARTLAEINPSVKILQKLGMKLIGEKVDPDDGPIWLWRLTRLR
jgi:[ribosomal protein S5]-alanine N-acetyltransferase